MTVRNQAICSVRTPIRNHLWNAGAFAFLMHALLDAVLGHVDLASWLLLLTKRRHILAQFMGIVDDVGPDVKNFKKGDRVVAAFDLACGACVPNPRPTSCDVLQHDNARRATTGMPSSKRGARARCHGFLLRTCLDARLSCCSWHSGQRSQDLTMMACRQVHVLQEAAVHSVRRHEPEDRGRELHQHPGDAVRPPHRCACSHLEHPS